MMLTALAWLSLACAAVSGAPTPAEDALFKAVGANSMADLKKALEAGASINTIGPGGQARVTPPPRLLLVFHTPVRWLRGGHTRGLSAVRVVTDGRRRSKPP